MTTPKSLAQYPPVYLAAVEKAFAEGEFVIYGSKASGTTIRMQMYGFLRTLRAAGREELADAIYIMDLPGKAGIKLLNRDKSPAALDIAKALGAAPEAASEPSDSFFDKVKT